MRQLQYLRNHINCVCAIDGDFKKYNGFDFYNLYYDYPIIMKALIKFGLIRKRTRNERFCYVFGNAITKMKSDVVVINYLSMAYKLKEALLCCPSKIYVQVHGYDVTWDYTDYDSGKKMFDQEYLDFASTIQGKVQFIANSLFTRDKLLQVGVESKNISVKYFGVPVERNVSIRVRKNDVFRILYLGRLVECKGPDLVIEAFNLACEQGIKAELIIAGGGRLYDSCVIIKDRSPYRDWIKILGEVTSEEGQQLRETSDIFTAHNLKGQITNQEEAFGVSIIEAMAAGLPVVTGRSGGLVESVLDGETGLLFEPGDVQAHANCFLELYHDDELRKKLAHNSIERVKQNFTLEHEKTRMLEILNIEP